MKSRAHRAILLAVAGLSVLGTTACDPLKYFASLDDTSGVIATVTTPGQINWKYKQAPGGGEILSGQVTITPPAIALVLEANSSPVRFSSAQAQFYDPSTVGANTAGTTIRYPATAWATPVVLPMPIVLKQANRAAAPDTVSVTLNGLITQDLIGRTDLSASGSAIPTITARVTLVGTNDFGASAKTEINVPVNVMTTVTEEK